MDHIKRYVAVKAKFGEDGQVLPTHVLWDDEAQYVVDEVTAITPAASFKVGGQGDRYTVIIGGQERYIYFERSAELFGNKLGRWFVEAIVRD